MEYMLLICGGEDAAEHANDGCGGWSEEMAERGQVVATLIAATGDFDLAEECAQDAFAAALARWPRDGIPDRPGAWLTTTARNRAVDRLRRDAAGAAKLREAALMTSAETAPN